MNRRPIDRRTFCLGSAAILSGFGPAPDAPQQRVGLGVVASLNGIRPFPDNDPWNQDVSRLPVDPKSDILIRSIGVNKPLHADFGTTYQKAPVGIPYVVVAGDQPRVPIRINVAPHESDPGPYPIPLDAPIEGGSDPSNTGDRHVLVIDRDAWKLYELYGAYREGNGWRAGSGAIFDLANNTNRPFEWTSADAAGLPIFPGLARYDEVVEAGALRHALRFTCNKVRRAYVAPARHWVNRLSDPNLPPLGMRVRLKRNFDTSGFPRPVRVILEGLKVYGMILADVGSDWYLSGAHDMRWDDDALGSLRKVKGSDLEVVKMGQIFTG